MTLAVGLSLSLTDFYRRAVEGVTAMQSDAEAISAVLSWSMGAIALILLGIGAPIVSSFLPDALGHLRREEDRRPLLIFAGVVSLQLAVGVYALTRAGAPGTPTASFWLTLAMIVAIGTSSACALFTMSRAMTRRRKRRAQLAAVMAPRLIAAHASERLAPEPHTGKLTWRRAEFLAAQWMEYLGVNSPVVTPEARDGGVDVRSENFVAQVKNYDRDRIGVALVRQLNGVAMLEGRSAMFFTTSGYTPDAQAFAREARLVLFVIKPAEGRLVPIGPLAQEIWERGVPARTLR